MITTSKLEQARGYISKTDPAISGNGGHARTFAVACRLVQFDLSPSDAWSLLLEYNRRCVPPWNERELQHKLKDAFRLAAHGTGFKFSATCQPARRVDPVTATKDYLKGFSAGEVCLWEASPVRPPDDWTLDGACLVSMLYEKDDLINVVVDHQVAAGKARPVGTGITLPRDEMIRRLTGGEFQSPAGGWLRMNPLDGKGISDNNVTAFRFALIECDGLPLDLQLSLFSKLPLPISAILTSGGRSLHAWVKVDCKDDEDYRSIVGRMLALLAKFGVDGKNKNPSRLSRLPGVTRTIGGEGDGRQRLLYLNPDPQVQTRIL